MSATARRDGIDLLTDDELFLPPEEAQAREREVIVDAAERAAIQAESASAAPSKDPKKAARDLAALEALGPLAKGDPGPMLKVLAAVQSATGQDTEPEPPAWEGQLTRTKQGFPQATIANAILILANAPAWLGVVVWDEFSSAIRIVKAPPWDAVDAPKTIELGEWTDTDDIRLGAWLSRHWLTKCPTEMARAAIEVVARRHSVHPVRDYLAGLTWDGTARVDTWTSTYLGVELTDYSRAVGRMFLISAIARVMQPGCKVDTMPILEGPQGARKSSAVMTLFGASWTSDTPPDLTSKDRFVGLRGRWVVEFAELDSFDRSEANRVKSFLSSPVDDYRPPYGRGNVRLPRQCVFVGTVNGSDYLRDPTGGRRFWPLRVGRIDLESLARDREQLWAEAVELHRQGATWWPSAELNDDFKAEQAERVQVDEWATVVEAYAAKSDFVIVGDVLEDALGIDKSRWTQSDANRVARILVQMGRERRQRRRGDRREWGYVERDQVTPGSQSGAVTTVTTGEP